MLQYRGFVRQDATSRAYVPGPALSTIASSIGRQLDVRARARPGLEELNRALTETVHLGKLDDRQVHFLDSIESGRAVRVASRAGRTMPAHCTSTGKAMLSLLDPNELRVLYPDEELDSLTDRSIHSFAGLARDLVTTRRRGYATSNQESEEGVTSVAIGIVSASGGLYGLTRPVENPAEASPPARDRSPIQTRRTDAYIPICALQMRSSVAVEPSRTTDRVGIPAHRARCSWRACDAYVLMSIVHDFGDQQAEEVLAAVAASVR